MGFLCTNKETKKDVNLNELKEEKFLRDIGLNNVNNLNPEINLCQEIFLSPEYYVTGAIKLTTGYTSNLTGCTTGTTGIYNLDYTGDIFLNFLITGDTNYQNYDGNFCLKVFSKDKWNPVISTGGLVNGSETIASCTNFTTISNSEPDFLKGEISVGSLPYWISHNTQNNLLYVSNIGGASKNISVIDANINQVITTIEPSTLGFTPTATAYDSLNNRLFIIENASNNIWVLDCVTNTIIAGPISYGPSNYNNIIYVESNNIFYLTDISSGKVVQIDANTLTPAIFASLSFSTTKQIVYNSINNEFYVFSDSTAGSIDVVNSIGTVTSTITLGNSPDFNGATFNSINNTIYATDYNNDEILILDCVTGAYSTIPTQTSQPYAIDFDSTNNNIFYSTFLDSAVYRLDGATNEIEKYFNFNDEVRYIFYNSINNTVYGTKYNSQKVAYITSDYVKQDFLEGSLPKTWGEYLIRPYYTFVSKDCNPGIIFDNWVSTTQYNSFQSSSDYYFMTVVDPPTPNLAPPGTEGVPDYTLVNDKLLIDGYVGARGPQSINNELNYFILTSIPLNNQILLILNGVQLTQDSDYTLIQQGGYGTPPIVEIYESIKSTDWLIATYIKAATNSSWFTNILGSYFIDTIKLDGFTSTTSPSYRTTGDNTLNFNPVTLNYEFFTTLPIDPNYALIVTVNGVKLAEDFQFFKSTSFDGRIIFDKNNTSFNVGDIITVFGYASSTGSEGNNYGSLKTNQFTPQWSVPPTFTNSNVTGRFIIEAFDNNSGILTNTLYVGFVPGQTNYQANFNNLSLNVYYKFKVTFEVTYTGYLNNKVTTCSYAEGYFDTANSYIKNTY
jgi:DNA-binding beta-propeller fold protein YncE